MSHNIPFLFGAGASQAPAPFQQQNIGSSNIPPQMRQALPPAGPINAETMSQINRLAELKRGQATRKGKKAKKNVSEETRLRNISLLESQLSAEHIQLAGQKAAGQPTHAEAPVQEQDPKQTLGPQQIAFLQNAQLPAGDLSALAGISPEQLAAIARLFQAGALPFPPAPANAPAQAPPQVQPQIPTAPRPSDGSGATLAKEDDVDMDKEEGELEEGEVSNTPQDRGFLRPPPTGPRNRSASPRGPLPRPGHRNSLPNQQASKRKLSAAQSAKPTQVNGTANGHRQVSKDEASKMFVLEMVRAGYTFEQLLKEVSNPKPLIRMFEQLRLHLPPNYVHVGSNQAASPTVAKLTANDETRKASIIKRPVPPKPVAQSREEYLAKLQAAKSSKKAGDNTPSSSAPKAAENPATPVQAAKPMPGSGAESPAKPSPSVKPNSLTELARRKLEALRALQASKQNGPTRTRSSPVLKTAQSPTSAQHAAPSPRQDGLGAGIANLAAKAAQMVTSQTTGVQVPSAGVSPPSNAAQSAFSPPPPTPFRSLTGLPGLFMASGPVSDLAPTQTPQTPPYPASVPHNTPPQTTTAQTSSRTIGATPIASPALLVVPRKRPTAADFFGDIPAQPPVAKRPFGHSRGTSEDEFFIIEASDDEDDEDDEMESKKAAGVQTKSFRDVPPLRDFPPRPLQSSASSTPGSGTPGGETYEQKLKQIEEYKRKIAEREMEKKARASAKPATPKPVDLTAASKPGPTTPATESKSNALTKQQEKERLQQRLLELEKNVGRRAETTAAPTANIPQFTEEKSAQASEEGELSDDSMSRFYEDDSNVQVPEMPATADDGEVGSQATTASATSMPEADASRTASAAPIESQFEQDVEMAASEAQERVLTPVQSGMQIQVDLSAEHSEVQIEQPLAQTDEMVDELVQRMNEDRVSSAAEEGQDSPVEAMEEEEESDDDGDDDDLDKAVTQQIEQYPDGNEMAMDHDAGESEADDEDESSSEASSDSEKYEPELPTVTNGGGDRGITANDIDLAPELQPSTPDLSAPLNQDQSEHTSYYTPYESALKGFKDYRYHPEFLNTVADGYKSLTYTHKIDPEKPLCQYEASGGKCNDKDCKYQHWNQMELDDNELLRAMGTQNIPARTAEDQKRWNEGLSKLIKDLRSSPEGRNAQAIAKRIADFRREFREDEGVGMVLNFNREED